MRQIALAAVAAIPVLLLPGASSAAAVDPSGGFTARGDMVLLGHFFALLALGVAGFALWKARRANAELARLSRSLDTALSALDARTKSADAERLLLEERLRTEIDTVAIRGASAAVPSLPAKVIPHPAIASKRRPGRPDPADVIEIALARVLQDDELELSLEPIVSVSRNAGVAFEVHACVEVDGAVHHIHRLSAAARHVERHAFEKALVMRAAEIARRRLGSKGDQMPLHCPVSEELLLNARACAEIATLVTLHPALADQIVLSVSAPLLAAATGATASGIDVLTGCGLGFAAEGWDKPVEGIRMLRDRGTVVLKVEADRLLDRLKARRGAASGAELVETARAEKLTIVARGIRSDEDAVELLDLGIDLMVGPRFAEPKRLRPLPLPRALPDAQVG